MNKYKIALVQMDTQADKAANLKDAVAFIEEGVAAGAKLITFPEVFNVIDNGEAQPESITDGETITLMAEQARKHNVWIHCGSIAEYQEGSNKSFNTTVLLNPQGEIVATYRKLHLFDVTLPDGTRTGESDRMDPGSEIVTVETELGHFGLSICYDIRFPELYRIMTLQGAQILFTPASFTMPTGKAHWESILRCRAIENGAYVVAAGQIGKKRGKFDKYGESVVIDPWGTVIAKARESACVTIAEIDLDYVAKVRQSIPSLANRRADIYEVKAKENK